MSTDLMIFEGQELEVLTKEDVNFDFDGTVLFNGKQVGEILGYSNYNRDIERHCENESVFIVTREKLNTEKVASSKFNTIISTLGQRGTKFLNEDGVFDLIYGSKLPKAKLFRKKVREIIKIVQQTGRYDVVENKIQQIEDNKERELSLSLYQLEQVLKVNPSDMLTTLAYNNMKQELTTYKQDKKLEEFENKVQAIEASQIEQKEKIEGLFLIGDRVQFVNEVNRIARAYDMQQSEVYQQAYNTLKSLYGIDLCTRVKNKREQIQSERLASGKKPYAPSTLKSKMNNLILADELEIWNEMGRSLNAVEQKLIKAE